jgi:ankyrin repeat protein
MVRIIPVLLFLLFSAGIKPLAAREFSPVNSGDTLIIALEDTIYSYLVAASQGDSAQVLAFLKAGVKVDTTAWDGVTALAYALQNSHPATVKVLVENGAGLNRKDNNGYSPLMLAVQSGDLPTSEYLIRKGANIDASDKKGITPLMLAAAIDSFALADMLLYYGADVLKPDKNGTSVLMIATLNGNYELVSALLDAGAEANAQDKKGLAPLHAAIWYGYWDIADLLLAFGADPCITALNGYPPLGVAIEAGDLVATKLLASAGADLNQRISFSQNPLSIAIEKRNDSIKQFLQQNHSRFNAWPSFSKFSLGTEINWNADDYRWSFFAGAIEKKYNLSLSLGWGFRPSAIRVLDVENETISTQYWENRGYLFLSLDKSVFLFHGKGDIQAGLYGGVKGIYTYGRYRGAMAKPVDRLKAAPGLGFVLEGRTVRYAIGYEYLNLDLYKFSPHHVNISLCFMLNRKKNNFIPDFLNW